MDGFSNISEEDNFLRNLHIVSFNKQIEDTFNLICLMCEEPFFTNFSGNDVCNDCRDHIKELIEEFKND